MPVGKSSIKRMNASQDTEEKKDAKIVETKTEQNETKKETTVTKKAASARKPRTVKKTQPKKAEEKKSETVSIKDDGQKVEESGVVSNITCDLPIYLM